jgi:hypothetical protein
MPKQQTTKVRVAPPAATDRTIPEQARQTWPAGGAAPMPEAAPPGPGSGAPLPNRMAVGQMRTQAKATKAARRSKDV